MTTNPNKKIQDARDAYAAKTNDIARLIDVLQMELDKHADAATSQPRPCWDSVGSLGKVRSDLIDLVGFLSGMEREEIKNFLAE